MLTTVVLIVVMLLLSAFFSGMEIAFTSKNRLKLEIDRKQNRMFDQIAEVFARHPGQYITTILVGNNIALVVYSLSMSLLLRSIYASLGWEQLARSGSVAVDTAVSTVIIIFFAEFLPKSIFRNNPNFYYRALAPVIYFFYIVLYPVARFTTLLSHGILHLLGRRVEERNITPSFDREDLAALLDSNSPEQHSEPDNELKLFQNALDFADLRVRDCMVPRVDVEAVDIDDTSIEQLTARFVDSKYSRIFVWRKSIDNIVGYVNSKSLFTRPRQIADVMMEVNFVPETMPLQLMLENFIKHRSNIAVVIDEFGGTAGVISLEDVLEQIITDVDVLRTAGPFALCKIGLVTGRTHQIRAHLAYLGKPVLGDIKYGNRKMNERTGTKTQALCAVRISFLDVPEENTLHYLSGKVIKLKDPQILQQFDALDKSKEA